MSPPDEHAQFASRRVDPQAVLIVGPGFPPCESPARRPVDAPPGARTNRELPPGDPAGTPDTDEEDGGGRLARRLLVAGIAIGLIALLSWVVLPVFGMVLPPLVPAALFALIALAALTASPDARARRKVSSAPDCAHEDGARPICCAGPRPPRLFK